ncbi:MAG TPA: reverse transcriptase domain-containing protein [Candidatus Nanoarchaeia archaeon]|nr:reverse transcriptase domain-containing protein [Candidatus Nanoarchaeia archaeon]
MKTYKSLWDKLCSYDNLFLAYKKARQHKTKKPYVLEFEKNLKDNLLQLRIELLFHIYKPRPLKTFILRDPKTRKISKSDFRDRVIHHALCRVIEPLFDKSFIYDSYANRKKKGTLKALKRFDKFKRKVTRNNRRAAFVLKADLKHYFDTVDQKILIGLIKKRISDPRVVWLVTQILDNHHVKQRGKGMPLGNLMSQFFANVYLNELDQFVKHGLRARYYLRYVDDFVILHANPSILSGYKCKINQFLETIQLNLHPDKSKIMPLPRGIGLLGFRVFPYHKLPAKRNIRKMQRRMLRYRELLLEKRVSYDQVYTGLEGWLAYVKNGNTYRFRSRFLEQFQDVVEGQIAGVEIGRWLKVK